MSPIIVDTTSDARTFKELQDEVLAHGFDDTRYRTRIKAWLNEAQQRIVRRARLYTRELQETFTTTAGTASYDLEPGLIRVRSVRLTDDHAQLEPATLEWVDQQPASTGKPSRYALSGESLVLYPTPSSGYPVEIRYWARPDKLVNDDDVLQIPNDYGDLLISWALWKAYKSEDDQPAAADHRSDFDRGLLELMADTSLRQVDGTRQIPGMWGRASRPKFQRP